MDKFKDLDLTPNTSLWEWEWVGAKPPTISKITLDYNNDMSECAFENSESF